MADTKWADVAHYYTNLECISGGNKFLALGFTPKFNPKPTNAYYQLGSLGVALTEYYEPILCHRDDMTEADAMTLWNSVANRVAFDDSVYAAYGSPLVIYRSKFKALQPEEFHCAIQLGFDVFGLIESGQAIRKESGNGL